MNNDFVNDDIRDIILERDGYLEQLEDYKFRCKKASEYIERRRERVNPEKTIYVNGNDLLNILQGENNGN